MLSRRLWLFWLKQKAICRSLVSCQICLRSTDFKIQDDAFIVHYSLLFVNGGHIRLKPVSSWMFKQAIQRGDLNEQFHIVSINLWQTNKKLSLKFTWITKLDIFMLSQRQIVLGDSFIKQFNKWYVAFREPQTRIHWYVSFNHFLMRKVNTILLRQLKHIRATTLLIFLILFVQIFHYFLINIH